MDDCIFCKLVAGEVPATVIYEDDDVIAFDDVNPQTPVHTLIIPKEHYHSLSDDVPPEILGKLFSKVPTVAKLKGVEESGYRIISNKGTDGRQTVFHLHIHILGGTTMPIGMGPAD
ncbi:MAG: histidine triad nucleotide-binding protein [Coriobacteriia bacterium]|nr:histidine triad nucleotide-binding protein [Coriobacteriia bacterium]MCL2750096.1 histidine triad nucleotide-binding protein [Coriobacteriia bacterium]